MDEFNLNLSTRPFPAYRLANVALILLFIVVAGASIGQAYYFRSYSELAQSNRSAEKNERVENAGLEAAREKFGESLDRPVTAAKMTEIEYLNNLIIRKHFSWTQVFSNLESVIPDNVHLTSLAPEISKDKVKLQLEIVCRSISDESEFVRRLQASRVFQDVVIGREAREGTGNSGDVNVTMTVSYFPEIATAEKVSEKVSK